MNAVNDHYLVPEQMKGTEKNLQSYITALTVEDAEDMFVEAKDKMLDINNWKKENSFFSSFILTDSHGKEVHRHAHAGDFIRIANAAGASLYNWIHVDAIEYDDYPDINTETIALRIHPSKEPRIKDEEEAYLINSAVSSTIVIERLDRRLTSLYHGRNEIIDGTGNQADEVWQSLINSFLIFE